MGSIVSRMTWTSYFVGTVFSMALRKRMNSWTMALHAPPDHLVFQYVVGGERRSGAVTLIVMGHGAGAALLIGSKAAKHPALGTFLRHAKFNT